MEFLEQGGTEASARTSTAPAAAPVVSPWSKSALTVLRARYLRRRPDGTVETPAAMIQRVVRAAASAEVRWSGAAAAVAAEARFGAMLSSLDFLPNSPTLMNAGTARPMLSACYVLPLPDSLDEIFETLRLAAQVQQSGGGTGYSFSHLRPHGDLVVTGGGQATGPVSFLRIFDGVTEGLRGGGKRRGANMGVLAVEHPDILEFINAKRHGGLTTFNLSVGVTQGFMEAAAKGGSWPVVHPGTGLTIGSADARQILEQLAEAAWATGDPGLLFLDRIARDNPTPLVGTIEATNPCGEVPLLPYESCNLGSINLSRFVRERDAASGSEIDWERLGETVHTAVRFLDDVLEVSHWPSPKVEEATLSNRKIGLGVMGFADMLIRLALPYASLAAARLAEELAMFIRTEAMVASRELAAERGVFPNWSRSVLPPRGPHLRHATLTSIAPTGTISMIAGTSNGIEPLYSLAQRRRALEHQLPFEIHPLFLQHAAGHGYDSPALREHVLRHGTLAGFAAVPAEAKELFRTATEIEPAAHLRIQAAFQRHVDNAVSKTVNLRREATPAEVLGIFQDACALGLKGIAVYRNGCLARQVLSTGDA